MTTTRFGSLLALATAVSLVTACGGDDGMPMPGVDSGPGDGGSADTGAADTGMGDTGPGDAGATAAHDCTPYTPTDEAGMSDGRWTEANDEAPMHGLTAPADPGGGHFHVTLGGFDGTRVAGQLQIYDGIDGTHIGNAVDGTRGAGVSARFTAAPGASYDVRPRQFLNESPASYPIAYVLTWELVPAVDCYEPNDTVEQAKRIPLEERIEAFLLAGFGDDIPSKEEYADLYAIEVAAAGEIVVDFVQVPDDLTIEVELLDESRSTVSRWHNAATGGGSLFEQTVMLDAAGTYYVRVTPWLLPDVFVADDEAAPASWTMPYTFEVRQP